MRLRIWIAALLLGGGAAAAQTLDELKDRWKRQDYSGLLLPLLDRRLGEYGAVDFQRATGPTPVQELDYMIATTMCAIPDQRKRGCDYSQDLKMYGNQMWFDGRPIATAPIAKACCIAEPEAPQPGVTIRMKPKTYRWDALLQEARTVIPDPVLGMRVEGAQQGDAVRAFGIVGIARQQSSWVCNFEVNYSYNAAHSDVTVRVDLLWRGVRIPHGSLWGEPVILQTAPGIAAKRIIQAFIETGQADVPTDELQISLWENRKPFYTRKFPFVRTWPRLQ